MSPVSCPYVRHALANAVGEPEGIAAAAAAATSPRNLLADFQHAVEGKLRIAVTDLNRSDARCPPSLPTSDRQVLIEAGELTPREKESIRHSEGLLEGNLIQAASREQWRRLIEEGRLDYIPDSLVEQSPHPPLTDRMNNIVINDDNNVARAASQQHHNRNC